MKNIKRMLTVPILLFPVLLYSGSSCNESKDIEKQLRDKIKFLTERVTDGLIEKCETVPMQSGVPANSQECEDYYEYRVLYARAFILDHFSDMLTDLDVNIAKYSHPSVICRQEGSSKCENLVRYFSSNKHLLMIEGTPRHYGACLWQCYASTSDSGRKHLSNIMISDIQLVSYLVQQAVTKDDQTIIFLNEIAPSSGYLRKEHLLRLISAYHNSGNLHGIVKDMLSGKEYCRKVLFMLRYLDFNSPARKEITNQIIRAGLKSASDVVVEESLSTYLWRKQTGDLSLFQGLLESPDKNVRQMAIAVLVNNGDAEYRDVIIEHKNLIYENGCPVNLKSNFISNFASLDKNRKKEHFDVINREFKYCIVHGEKTRQRKNWCSFIYRGASASDKLSDWLVKENGELLDELGDKIPGDLSPIVAPRLKRNTLVSFFSNKRFRVDRDLIYIWKHDKGQTELILEDLWKQKSMRDEISEAMFLTLPVETVKSKYPKICKHLKDPVKLFKALLVTPEHENHHSLRALLISTMPESERKQKAQLLWERISKNSLERLEDLITVNATLYEICNRK